jgi:hypothetical protein
MNPFNSPSTENVSPPDQKGTSPDFLIDLLSGNDPLPHPLAQPVTDVHKESDSLDFLDQNIEYNGQSDCKISSEDTRHSDSTTEQYLKCLKSLAGPNLVHYYFVDVALNHYKIVFPFQYDHLLGFFMNFIHSLERFFPLDEYLCNIQLLLLLMVLPNTAHDKHYLNV